MRKTLSMIILVFLCAGTLAGCGEKTDTTNLPHNAKIKITDKKTDIIETDKLETEDEITYTVPEPVKINGDEYDVTYQFSNSDEDGDYIGYVYYDSASANLEDVKKYVDSVYGELEKDTTEGKYGPGQDGRYIIKGDDKAWTIGCLSTDNGSTRIVITRDATLE